MKLFALVVYGVFGSLAAAPSFAVLAFPALVVPREAFSPLTAHP